MATQFIVNEKGEKTAVVLSIDDYENLLQQHHFEFELTDEYKLMIDEMIEKEENGQAEYVSLADIKTRF